MSNPVRLHKKQSRDEKLEAWAIAHAPLLFKILIFLLILGFVMGCYAVVGVCAVESGAMRNFITRGV